MASSSTRARQLPGARRVASLLGVTWTPGDETLHRRELHILVTLVVSVLAALIWAPLYLYYREFAAAAVAASYSVFSLVSVTTFRFHRNYVVFRTTQFLLFLATPLLVMLALGGFINSSAVIVSALLAPIGALVWGSKREAIIWFFGFLGALAIGGVLEALVSGPGNLPTPVVTIFFVMNLGLVSSITFLLLRHFVEQKNVAMEMLGQEQEKSERLLLNVLPSEVAARLKEGEATIADYHDGVSILFADVVGFTQMASATSPGRVVEVLNRIFSAFDALAEKHGVEKIHTIGDGYMAAAGVPQSRFDHAQSVARMALEMMAYEPPALDGARLQFRVGINSGEVVAGVVGHSKFQYDLWGDAVNVASRMESQGVPGKIQISEATYDLLKGEFRCAPCGALEVKGKGEMLTWFLEGLAPA